MNINESIYNVQNNNLYGKYSSAVKAADAKADGSNDSSKKTDSLVCSDDSGAVSKTYTANGTLEGVKTSGRSVTHFLSQGKNASAVHSKEQYDDRYNSIISGRFFHHYEAGQKVMIGGKEYTLDENKSIDIEYGEDIYDVQIVNSDYSESAEFSYDDETRQKAEAIIDEWQEQVAEIKEEKSAPEQDDQSEREVSAGDQTGSSGKVGINAGKLARMLAAAKTRSQVQAVIAKIRSDLNECEAGKNNGMDVDEASVKAAQQLLQQANALMGSAENREATPEEEMAAALAALM